MLHGFGIVGIPKRGGGPLVKPAPGSIIDPQHWAAQGMVGCWLLNRSAINSANGKRAIMAGDAVFALDGVRITTSTEAHSASRIETGSTLPGSVNEVTLVATYMRQHESATGFVVASYRDAVAPLAQITSLSTTLRLQVRTTTSALITLEATVALNTWIHAAIAVSRTGSKVLYKDGAIAASDGTSLDGEITSSLLTLGNTYDGTWANASLNGTIRNAYAYNKQLNPSAIARLHAEPYCMFWEPGRRTIFLPTEEGGESPQSATAGTATATGAAYAAAATPGAVTKEATTASSTGAAYGAVAEATRTVEAATATSTGAAYAAGAAAGAVTKEVSTATSTGAAYAASAAPGVVTREATTATSTGAAHNAAGTKYQYARPALDVTDGSWTDQDGGTNLYAAIDEATADDDDYIQSESLPSDDACVIALGALTDPVRSDLHKIRYRYRRSDTDTALSLAVRLRQGATLIAGWTHNTVPDSWTTAEQTLTGEQTDSITDYSDLRIEMVANTPA